MKHLYILNSIYSSVNFSFEIDSIISDARINDVTVLVCDKCVGRCSSNSFGIRILCCECRKRANAVLNTISGIHLLKMSDFCDNIIQHEKYYYDSLKALNRIKYKGIEIGYGVSSYYISLTRNLTPKITPSLKKLLDKWLESSMLYTDIADKVITPDYDAVYVVNGRMFDSKPFQEIAFAKGVSIIMGESARSIKGDMVRMNFNNVRVHSVKGNCDNIRHFWESSNVPLEERRKIAASFYERRANAIATNDKVYTAGQKKDLMPDDWDETKINIAIFNSSEDEFAAIGGEFERNNLFDSQMSGIRFILDNVRDTNIHFYLRIHPNLMKIKYKYHTDLYELPKEYSNITVIPGNSEVSSYSLMRSCDRIITFGSTMGVESAYAGKTAMVMRPCFYYHLKVNFVPKSREEVIDFINGKIAYQPIKEDALKYSYYYYNNERRSVDNPECFFSNRVKIKVFNKTISFNCMNLACSKLRMKYCIFLQVLGGLVAKTFVPYKEQ